MEKELTISNLEVTIAKLELKHLEVIDKLSRPNNDYIIRCITCTDSNKFIAVNGDWKKVVGWEESDCIGKSIFDFIPPYDLDRVTLESFKLKNESEFESFICDMTCKDGNTVTVDWKAKKFPDINSTISIGRVKR